MHPLLITFLIDIGVQLVAYAVSAPLKTEKFYDLSGSLTYCSCFLYSLLQNQSPDARQIVSVALCMIWCLRLGVFLFMRVISIGHDKRFEEFKESPVKLFFVFVAQIVWIWCTGLPVFIITTAQKSSEVTSLANPLDIIGIVLWSIGFLIEVIADHQKNVFKNKNPKKFMTTGLWKYSRHPNYFGEFVIWIGMFILCINGFVESWMWISAISPVFVFFLIYFGSGVRLLEISADERYGNLTEYQEYKKRTSKFLPLPPSMCTKET